MELNGQVAVVTGGASGLATVRTLAGAGAGAGVGVGVGVLDRDGAPAKQVAAECRGALPVEVDVADEGSVQHAMRAVVDAFGSVHVCVNAAGVGAGGKVVARGKPCRWRSSAPSSMSTSSACSTSCASAPS